MNEAKNAAQSRPKFDQTHAVLVQNGILLPLLHDCCENICHSIFVREHTSRLAHEENEVSIAEAECLRKPFKLKVRHCRAGWQNLLQLEAALLRDSRIIDLSSVDTIYEEATGILTLTLSHHDEALVQQQLLL